jgi:hypothetical protein
MSAMTVFYQECPVCGRNLRVPAKYFGRRMTCTHCQGEFRAGKEELPALPKQEASLPASMVAPALIQSELTQSQIGEV